MGTHDMVSFDNTFTINWLGYDNVHEYYEAASPHNQLPNVTTPLLIINSRNDPLIPNVVNPGPEIMKDLPNAVAIECEYGGHIGFWTPFRGDWTAQCVISFIQQPHLNQRNLSKARSKTGIRRKNSQQIAQMLRVTSKTGLNDYKGIERMVSHDSSNSIKEGGGEEGDDDDDDDDSFRDVLEEEGEGQGEGEEEEEELGVRPSEYHSAGEAEEEEEEEEEGEEEQLMPDPNK
jgi:hypothetical protein